jgi:hypothetical protein
MNWTEALPYIKNEYKARRPLDKYRDRTIMSFDSGETFAKLYSDECSDYWYKTDITQEDLDGDWTVIVETVHEIS